MARILPITSALPDLKALSETLRRYAQELPYEELPALVGELEAAKARVWSRLARHEQEEPPASDGENLLDAEAMARRLDVPQSWLREQARRGRIPYIRLGHYMRFDPRAVVRRLTGEDIVTIRKV